MGSHWGCWVGAGVAPKGYNVLGKPLQQGDCIQHKLWMIVKVVRYLHVMQKCCECVIVKVVRYWRQMQKKRGSFI